MSSSIFNNAMFGPLFGEPEVARLFCAEAMLTQMMAFEIAYTKALGQVGLVSQEAAREAVLRMRDFTPDTQALARQTAVDGLPVRELVRQIRAHCGADLAEAIHKGTTSQDVLDTSLTLSLCEANEHLDAALGQILARLITLLKTHGQARLMGRTRMQTALPITVADRVQSWLNPITSHRQKLLSLRPEVERLQFGGPVGVRGDKGAELAAALAEGLGLSNPPRSWHTEREALVSYAHWLALVTGSLGKIGQDIALMAQQGIDEIALDGGGTSSAMPHKQNPVLAELLVTLARYNAVQISGMHHAMVHEQERSGSAWALEWMILPQMVETTASALGAANDLLGQITRLGTA